MQNTKEFKYYTVAGESFPYAFLSNGSQDEFITDDMVLMTDQEIDEYYAAQELELLKGEEVLWAASEIPVIARQLEAIEEDEAGETPDDLLPGSRSQWLGYRGKVRNWKEGAEGFPDIEHRPVRPT